MKDTRGAEARTFTALCMTVTPFHEDGSLDEEALRAHFRRLVEAGWGLQVAAPAAGEGHVLTIAEHRRVYDIAVEVGKGKVPLWSNTRESHSAAAAYEVAKEAVAAGLDVIQFYQLIPGQRFIATEREQEAYWHELLDAVDHPVCISLQTNGPGYRATLPLITRLCRKYKQIVAVGCYQEFSNDEIVEWRDALPPSIQIVSLILNFQLGATVTQHEDSNYLPYTHHRLVDAYRESDLKKLREALVIRERARAILGRVPGCGRGRTPVRVKAMMKILGLSNGVLRPPLLLPTDEELRQLAEAYARSGVPEAEEAFRREALN